MAQSTPLKLTFIQLDIVAVSTCPEPTPAVNDGIPVFISSTGQLGTVGTGGTTFIQTLTGDGAVVVSPLAGNINIGGTTYVGGNIVPTVANVINIGTPTMRFGSLYLAGNTIDIGGATITTGSDGQLNLTSTSGNVTFNSNSINFLNTVASTTAQNGDFQITGNVIAQKNLTVSGNLLVLGNSVTISTENTSFADSIIEIHTQANLAPLIGNDGRDIGLHLHYYDTQDKHAFVGRVNSTGRFTYLINATEGVGNVFTGTTGTAEFGAIYANQYFYANGTPYYNTGYTGSVGSTGYTGSQGSTGYTGSTGSQGTTGAQGTSGTTFSTSQLAKAWVNFNGISGSVGIRASYNVSSITYNGTGDYTINFTNAMTDANYSVVAIGQRNASTNVPHSLVPYANGSTTSTYATTYIRLVYRSWDGSTGDALTGNVTVFR